MASFSESLPFRLLVNLTFGKLFAELAPIEDKALGGWLPYWRYRVRWKLSGFLHPVDRDRPPAVDEAASLRKLIGLMSPDQEPSFTAASIQEHNVCERGLRLRQGDLETRNRWPLRLRLCDSASERNADQRRAYQKPRPTMQWRYATLLDALF